VYEIALSVAACVRAGTRVDVGWVVDTDGLAGLAPAGALAITPGGGRVGSLVLGALDDTLAELAGRVSGGRLVDVHVGDLDALVAGLACGGRVRCLLVPAANLPAELWDRLGAREAVCLVSRLDGTDVVETTLYTAATIADAPAGAQESFGRGTSGAVVSEEQVVTVLRPVPRLVIVGAGAIAEALADFATRLGWRVESTTDAQTATGMIAGLAGLDNLVVISHDNELAGRSLAAALSTAVGYIGALGSRRTQQSRADWLAYRGVTDLRRVHGPAGLEIGASTPPEIAISVLAEALAVSAGAGVVHCDA
jgi:xanthine dehydrogenase accessory factor